MMKCPRCDTTVLQEHQREGIVVDGCPNCRGIWLDRGELEKLIVRLAPEPNATYRRDDDDDDDDYRRYSKKDDEYNRRHHKKRSWFESLGEIFD